ncbi:MAG: DUF1826 domain-containing protein [Sphingomonadaceae bacterium]
MSTALLDHPAQNQSAVAIGYDDTILGRIDDPAVQLALWRRPRPPSLYWLDTLEWASVDSIDTTVEGPKFGRQIAQLLRDAGYKQAGQTVALAEEISARASQFAKLMTTDRLRLRLEVIETDACRKFHMDYVTARLLMPLSGPGTQWKAADENAPVHQLEAGNVCILKGRLRVEDPAILHRSPPVAHTGETRLLLVLDPAKNADMSVNLRK